MCVCVCVSWLYIYYIYTHQYFHANSCHIFHCKQSISFSQTLCLNRICFENTFFDKRCNELEV